MTSANCHDLLAQRNELLAVLIAIAHEINGARSCDTGSYLPQHLEDRIFDVIEKVMEAQNVDNKIAL